MGFTLTKCVNNGLECFLSNIEFDLNDERNLFFLKCSTFQYITFHWGMLICINTCFDQKMYNGVYKIITLSYYVALKLTKLELLLGKGYVAQVCLLASDYFCGHSENFLKVDLELDLSRS